MQLSFSIASEFIIGHVFHVHKFFNLIKKLIMMLADPVFNLKDVIVLILNKIAKKKVDFDHHVNFPSPEVCKCFFF